MIVEIQPYRDAEAISQGRREEPCAGGGADQGEARELNLNGTCRRSLANDEVELVVLHGRVEDLFHRRIETVDFVDEEDVAILQVGEQRREVTRLGNDGARSG